ncbi:MAG: aminopeptidase [Thermodesulfobacteriota bacterium]|nr:aminopeptidase [Thermodesulfobacteriota bacterium]
MKITNWLIMKKLIILVAIIFLFSCSIRSISDSGYSSKFPTNNPLYKGELSEFEVLGIELSKKATEEVIKNSLKKRPHVSLQKGGAVMVIQSGVLIPDETMVKHLERYFTVGVFSGIPEESVKPVNFSHALRLAAAKGGYQTIICYWGILESGKINRTTKTISWVPIVGWLIPDETEHMRIRLKVALIDVHTGGWQAFMPQPFTETAISSIVSREKADQGLVSVLKDYGYKAAVDEIIMRYTK